jgi:dynein heavy chain 1
MLEDETTLNPASSIAAPAASEVLLVFDYQKLQEYFELLLPLVLGADVSDLENTLFSYPDTAEKFKRFANDPQTPVIFILKERDNVKDEGNT